MKRPNGDGCISYKQFGKELLAVLVLMFIVLFAKDNPTEA